MDDMMGHTMVKDPIGDISDSTEASDQEILKETISHSNHGLLHWSYRGFHFDLHPGWDEQDF